MFQRTKKKKNTITSQLEFDGTTVPVHILVERRNNARVSIGKKGINIRLPIMMGQHDRQQQISAFTEWARQTFAKRPELLNRFRPQSIPDGHEFTLQGTTYEVAFVEHDKATSSSKLVGNIVYLKLAPGAPPEQIPQLISRAIAKKYYNQVYNQLLYLNKLYFNKPVNDFKLKYTNSLWGSCSRKGNINISTRLLFAPDEVIDYVLIHELAHLIHHNHSKAYWNEVARCMPEYKQHVQWLKQHGKHCDFIV